MPVRFPIVPGAAPLLAALCLVRPSASTAAAPDWEKLLASYQTMERIAGLNGESGNNGNEWNNHDGKPALGAELSEPHSAMGDLAGNIYIADKNAHAIRKITTDGIIHTVAGTNNQGFDGDGPAAGKMLNGPQNAYVMPDGVLYVMDTGNRRIRRVGLDGVMTTLFTETDETWLSRGLWVSRDASVIYYCTVTDLKKWTPAQGNSPGETLATGFIEPGNIDVAANGDIYVSDRGLSRVFRVPPNNTPEVDPVPVAGVEAPADDETVEAGTPALSIGMVGARGVAFHPFGGYFVATHRGGDLWYVDTEGVGHIYIRGTNGSIFGSNPVAVPTQTQVMSEPRSVTVALNGDILLATNDSGIIRRVRYTGPPMSEPAVDASVNAGQVRLSITGAAGSWFAVESATDPAGAWAPAGYAPLTEGAAQWTDPAPVSGAPRRFHRVTLFRGWPN